MDKSEVFLGVDLGKTNTRVSVFASGQEIASTTLQGLLGLAAADGVSRVSEVVLHGVNELAPTLAGSRILGLGAGVAGAVAQPKAALELAQQLSKVLAAPCAITSDIVTAHIGALGGAPGTTLVAGTGAVALGVSELGNWKIADGWGPILGDVGSGSWLGRKGLRAVMAARSVAAAQTSLAALYSEFAARQDQDLNDSPVAWLSAQSQPFRAAAKFAPVVIQAAETGDLIAQELVNEAVNALVTTAVEAATLDGTEPKRNQRIAVMGGLVQAPLFRSQLLTQLESAGFLPEEPQASALVGARMLLDSVDLPHERFVYRAH